MRDLGSPEDARRLDVDHLRALVVDEHESQHVFRVLLDAFSRPGTICQFPPALVARMDPGLIPIACLASQGVPVFICSRGAGELGHALELATGGHLSALVDAKLIAVLEPETLDWNLIPVGEPLRPDLAAQVSLRVRCNLDGDTNGTEGWSGFTVSGPGVRDSLTVRLDPGTLDLSRFIDARTNTAPCGFDAWLIDDAGRVVGLPRTSHVTVAPAVSRSKEN